MRTIIIVIYLICFQFGYAQIHLDISDNKLAIAVCEEDFYPDSMDARIIISNVTRGESDNSFKKKKRLLIDYVQNNKLGAVKETNVRDKYRKRIWGVSVLCNEKMAFYDLRFYSLEEFLLFQDFIIDLEVKDLRISNIIYKNWSTKLERIIDCAKNKVREEYSKKLDNCIEHKTGVMEFRTLDHSTEWRERYYINGAQRSPERYYTSGLIINGGGVRINREPYKYIIKAEELKETIFVKVEGKCMN